MNARNLLHPAMVEALSWFPPGTLTSTFRSVEEQRRLRTEWERGRSRFPAEKPGHSTHHTGLAFDYVVRAGSSSRDQLELGRWWKSLGGWWSERDPIHFEHPDARAALAQGLVRLNWWL